MRHLELNGPDHLVARQPPIAFGKHQFDLDDLALCAALHRGGDGGSRRRTGTSSLLLFISPLFLFFLLRSNPLSLSPPLASPALPLPAPLSTPRTR